MSDTIAAGRDLDTQVAILVMGYTDVHNRDTNGGNSWWGLPPTASEHGTRIPHYSTYMGDAWEVVEHLREQGWEMTLSCNSFKTNMWDCRLFLISPDYPYLTEKKAIAHGPDAPTAICLAALQAIGVDNE